MKASSLLLPGFLIALSLGLACSKRPIHNPTTAGAAQANAARRAAGPELRFRDVTEQAGVKSTYHNGQEAGESAILESLGGGVGILDYDLDGRLDLFFPGGGRLGPERKITGLPSSLWRSDGQLRFENVSELSGTAASRYYSHGCAAADFDNDGFADILVTGYGGLQLFHNQGDGTFVEMASDAKLHDELWSTSAAWGDFNADGSLDLYITHYVDWSWDNHPRCGSAVPGKHDICPPKEFNGLNDMVYFSHGDGTFRDATAEAGLVSNGKGLGVIAADVNSDGRLDVYVANDTTNNFLYLNEGDKFREVGLVSGTAVDDRGIANGSMGVAVFDFNHDLEPDIWVTNYENETFALYRNEKDGNFVCVSEASGITALGGLYVGFGTVAADVDLDGDEDIVVANGHVMNHSRTPGPQQAIVMRNEGQGRFARASFPPDSYFSTGRWGRGLALGDLDNDGDIDLVFSNTNEPAAVLANETPEAGSSLRLLLLGAVSNRNAIGAHLILETTQGRFLRTICGGGSYLSQSDYGQTFGLPQGAKAVRVEIRWPSGAVQTIEGAQLTADSIIVEAASQP